MKVFEDLTKKLKVGQEAENFQKKLLTETIQDIVERDV